jgi:hypothetical protein
MMNGVLNDHLYLPGDLFMFSSSNDRTFGGPYLRIKPAYGAENRIRSFDDGEIFIVIATVMNSGWNDGTSELWAYVLTNTGLGWFANNNQVGPNQVGFNEVIRIHR